MANIGIIYGTTAVQKIHIMRSLVCNSADAAPDFLKSPPSQRYNFNAMLNSIFNPSLLLPVLFFSLPFYFLAKFLEKKLQPRHSGKQFLLWLTAILVSAFLYFYVFGTLYVQFIHLRLFAN